MKEYVRGATVLVKMEVRSGGVLGDPTSALCRVVDPVGNTVVNNVPMSKTATGKYEYAYTSTSTAVLGEYTAIVIAVVGARKTFAKEDFMIVWGSEP